MDRITVIKLVRVVLTAVMMAAVLSLVPKTPQPNVDFVEKEH